MTLGTRNAVPVFAGAFASASSGGNEGWTISSRNGCLEFYGAGHGLHIVRRDLGQFFHIFQYVIPVGPGISFFLPASDKAFLIMQHSQLAQL